MRKQQLYTTWTQYQNYSPANTIIFSRECDRNGILSNNFICEKLNINGENWKTVDAFFKAQMFTDPSVRYEISQLQSSADIEKMINVYQLQSSTREDWDSIKDSVMHQGLVAKFAQNPRLKSFLIGTGNQTLIFSSKDAYWGNGGDGNGENMLGKFLMGIRKAELDKAERLNEKAYNPQPSQWNTQSSFYKSNTQLFQSAQQTSSLLQNPKNTSVGVQPMVGPFNQTTSGWNKTQQDPKCYF